MLSQVEDEGKRQQVLNLMDNYILELGILEDAYITSRYLLREFERGEIERLTLVVTKVLHDAR